MNFIEVYEYYIGGSSVVVVEVDHNGYRCPQPPDIHQCRNNSEDVKDPALCEWYPHSHHSVSNAAQPSFSRVHCAYNLVGRRY